MKMIYDFDIRELREKDICFVSEVYTYNLPDRVEVKFLLNS